MEEIQFALTGCQRQLTATCLNLHLGLGGGGTRENRRVKDKTGGERATGRREAAGTDRREKTRGQEVSKTVVISRQNTSPKKGSYARARPGPLQARHIGPKCIVINISLATAGKERQLD